MTACAGAWSRAWQVGSSGASLRGGSAKADLRLGSLSLPWHLGALTLKPKTFPLKVLGVQVDLPVTIAFDMKSEGDAVALQLSVEASLRSLQDNALQIGRAMPVPRGNCDRQGVNPVVNSIDEASISPGGDTAIVAISGHVTAWGCIKPAGIVIKTEGPHDSVSVTATVRVSVVDGKQLGLQLAGPVTVKTGNALTEEAVRLFTGDISASITNALTNALNADQARAKLPTLPASKERSMMRPSRRMATRC